MINVGILGSTRGTIMPGLIEAIESGRLHANITVVISNKPEAMILQRAALNALPWMFVDPRGLTRNDYDKKVSDLLRLHVVDLVLLIGYMRILSPEFIADWKGKVINVHPSLLPSFSGMMDLNVHRAVIDCGMKTTGCTVHHVTETVDEGPVILQKTCPVHEDDTPETLKERVQRLECEALVEVISDYSRKLHL